MVGGNLSISLGICMFSGGRWDIYSLNCHGQVEYRSVCFLGVGGI